MDKPKRVAQIGLSHTNKPYFDYLLTTSDDVAVGQRVSVSFRQKSVAGIVVGLSDHSNVATHKLKPIEHLIDNAPLFPDDILQLCRFASDYYHRPLSDVLNTALPALLKQGKPEQFALQMVWRTLSDSAQSISHRAKAQQHAFTLLQQHADGLSTSALAEQGIKLTTLKSLQEKGLIAAVEQPRSFTNISTSQPSPPTLLTEQAQVVDALINHQGFRCDVLHGITGSGKTEVYMRLIDAQIQQQKQVLVLVPEIGLTPQLYSRLQQRFSVPIAVMHSGLNDRERLDAWLLSKQTQAKILIGTRSAIFTPLPDLSLIIIDEEHDASFKQQEGMKYSARDLAIIRAQMRSIPILLGSATPSLETLFNVQQKKYHYWQLTTRAGGALSPSYQVIDLRRQGLQNGLSKPLITEMQQHLQQGNQVLLFLNRRGFAPVLMCHECAWISTCPHCDAYLTMHLKLHMMQCHHCGFQQAQPNQCHDCHSQQLVPVGLGTQRLEEQLQQLFPEQTIMRIDRDSMRRKHAFDQAIEKIHRGDANILIGTQMLAKGHHFPNVTLVAILDADSGFFSCDFRASERLGQLLLQVAGRAGRANKPGTVAIQTHCPDHPLLMTLIKQGYSAFAKALLEEREQAMFPPFCYLAIYRIEAKQHSQACEILKKVASLLKQHIQQPTISLLGPVPAPLSKRADLYRYQLLIRSPNRKTLHQLLNQSSQAIEKLNNKDTKLTLDIDPIDIF